MTGPKIVYDILANAEGRPDVEALARALEQVDKAIDPAAAARAQKLADELRELGAQQAAITRFVELKAATQGAAQALETAQAAAQAAGQALAASEAPTKAEAGAFQKLSDAVKAAKADLQAQTEALGAARTNLGALGVSTEALAAHQASLKTALAGTVKEVQALGQQGQAVAAFQELAAATDKARAALAAADASFESFRAEIKGAEAPTASQAAQLAKLAEAARQAQIASLAAAVAQGEVGAKLRAAGVDVDALVSAEKRLQVASVSAGHALNDAFGAAGVRSLEAIKAEALATDRAIAFLETQLRTGAISAESFARAVAGAKARLHELQVEAHTVPAVPSALQQANAQIGGLIQRFGLLAASLAGIGFAVKPVFDLAVQIDSLRRALTSVTGSSAEADRQIEFLRRTANAAGLSFSGVADSFLSFTAAARTSGISTQVVERVFAATAQAAGNLGLSGEKVNRILTALGQIASKGVVSMEELRQQLGESLPGAMGLLAKGLGLTDQQLIKLVESGKLLAVDALPALADALVSLGSKTGQVEGLSASFNRLKNAVTETFTALTAADSAGGEASAGLLKTAAFAVRALALGFATLGETVTLAGKKIGLTLAAIVTGDFKNLNAAIEEAETQGSARLQRLADRIDLFQQKTAAATPAVAAMGAATASAGQQAADAAAGLDKTAAASTGAATAAAGLAQAQGAATGAATASAAAQTAAGAAAVTAGQGALTAGAQWVKLGVDYGEVTEALTKQVAVSAKAVEAKKHEGEALVALTKLSGDESAALRAELAAAEGNLGALEKLATGRKAETEVLKAQIAALEAVAKLLGDPDGSRQKEIDKIKQTADLRGAEADKAREQVEQQKAEVAQREISIRTYGDNAKALDTLKAAYQTTAAALRVTTEAQKLGVASTEDVEKAALRAAKAEALYRDAVKDSGTATDLKTAAIRRAFSAAETQNNLALAQLKTAALTAQSNGVAYTQGELTIRQNELSIGITRKKIDAVTAEAEAAIRQAKIEENALKKDDELYARKKAEIQARLENARARIAETEIGAEQVKQLQLENQILQQNALALQFATAEIDNYASGLDRAGKAFDIFSQKASAARNRLELSKLGSSSDVLDASGKVVGNSSSTVFGGKQVKVPDGYVFDQAAFDRDQANVLPGGRAPDPANYYKAPSGGSGSLVAGGGEPTAEVAARLKEIADNLAAKFGGSGSLHTVEVKTPSGAQRIGVASQADAAALAGMLSQLGQAARSAGATV